MNYQNWKLILGDTQTKEWNDRQYRFRISADDQEEMRIIGSLQSNTPIKHFIEKTVEDTLIRSLAFLSYYNVNPTFNNQKGDIGTGFFWFPLDELDNEKFDLISKRVEEENKDNENDEDDDEEAALPDFPVMSTVSRPIIEAATSDTYLTNINRISEDERQKRLQEEIKQKKEEQVNKIEEWLEEGMSDDPYPRHFSTFSEVVGRLPSVILLGLLNDERERVENIYRVFKNIQTWQDYDDEDIGPSFLLNKLNELSRDYPVFENPAIEAFCLDDTDRGCEYHVTKNRAYRIGNSLKTCESCSSDLIRVYRTGLDKEVKDAWMMGLLPELVVARLFAEADWTEEVLPHRRVQMLDDDGNMTSSIEVDVCIQSNNDEAIFVEVTSQEEPLDRLSKKKQKFEDTGIEYDGLIQVAPGAHGEMIPFGDGVVSAGGWMIRGLETKGFKHDVRDKIESVSLE